MHEQYMFFFDAEGGLNYVYLTKWTTANQAVYQLVRQYGEEIDLLEQVTGLSVHTLRATAISNSLENELT